MVTVPRAAAPTCPTAVVNSARTTGSATHKGFGSSGAAASLAHRKQPVDYDPFAPLEPSDAVRKQGARVGANPCEKHGDLLQHAAPDLA
eukprot:5569723-Alexandrium_andersonii.AAC.1